ncbi:MAG: 50S ribosomal protein L29 [Candidatus Levybacteria bacterium]|nr:50S ribosomal protein L29 [Candidatus Levybacteria bacterium]
MKTKEKKELHQKTVVELQKLVSDARIKLFSYKMEKDQGKLTDVRLMSKTRDDIAKLLTVLQIRKKEGGKHA